MATDNFEKCLDFVLKFEGGFVNNPKDPGGPTTLGVTQSTLSSFLGRAAKIAELKALTPKKVAPIYRQKFWDPIMCEDLPAGVDLAVFDYGVHAGPSRSIKALQLVLKVPADGQIGPRTLAAAKKLNAKKTIHLLCDERIEFLHNLKVFKSFGKRLLSRVEKCRKAALSMI
jgi:lysozyme family protein